MIFRKFSIAMSQNSFALQIKFKKTHFFLYSSLIYELFILQDCFVISGLFCRLFFLVLGKLFLLNLSAKNLFGM